ncbi:polyphosphate:AMP phosphotransferase [endosymbiont of Lamellibrachia barhami]|uniref:polyphosphate:AMP phosphotransferase n=1 Tax=endosymbiont of Lamellibrachia barhami TaxID=205975 RepID=UPI0015A8A642|nr:polyphosphate:AMP phosphotransferase [endosymbiont of Lamellibrachia barhami]
MFEATKVGRKVTKEDYKAEEADLRTELLHVQREIRKTNTSVVIIVAGVEGAGKGGVVNRLNEWLDSRNVQTFAFWDQTDEEQARPRYWRFWRTLAPKGDISILFGGWYLAPIEHRFRNQCDDAQLDAELNRIADFERMLTEDGTLILKFWFHLPETVQKKRLKSLSRDDKSRWKMLPKKARFSQQYRHFEKVAERVIRHTDTGATPWYMIEATDKRYRDLTVGRTLLETMKSRLESPQLLCIPATSHAPTLPNQASAQITLLDHVDLSKTKERDLYKSELNKLQAEANELAWKAYQKKRSCVLVFEGVDAGGKGGAIRRLTSAVDARLYRTIPIAAPTDEEKAHHYLWRFWRHLPRAGRMTIFDRSWYGRVLVERVEGFASDPEWQRAYSEINQFEQQMSENGIIVMKFWLHISADEQLARFEARKATPYKQHKITDEDWRNREKWEEYKLAVNEMVIRTSTEFAPWHLIPGNDKKYARVTVLRTIVERLRAELKSDGKASGYIPCGPLKV